MDTKGGEVVEIQLLVLRGTEMPTEPAVVTTAVHRIATERGGDEEEERGARRAKVVQRLKVSSVAIVQTVDTFEDSVSLTRTQEVEDERKGVSELDRKQVHEKNEGTHDRASLGVFQ